VPQSTCKCIKSVWEPVYLNHLALWFEAGLAKTTLGSSLTLRVNGAKEADRQTDMQRQRNKETDRQTDRQTDR